MRIITLIAVILTALSFVSCDGKSIDTKSDALIIVTAAYVENGDTIIIEGTGFGTTEPTATLTGFDDANLSDELKVQDFSDTNIALTLPGTIIEGSYVLDVNTANGSFSVTFVGLKGEPGEDGIDGEKGDKGDPGIDGENGIDGDPGLDGEDGENSEDGTDGKNASCFGNTTPEIVKISFEKAPGKDFRKNVSIPLTLETQDADGDTLTVIFSGVGATVTPTGDGTYSVIPTMTGGPFTFGIIVNDGCQTVTGSFTLDKVVTTNVNYPTHMFLLVEDGDSATLRIIWPQVRDGAPVVGDTGLYDVTGLTFNPLDGNMYTVSNDDHTLYRISEDADTDTVVEIGDDFVYAIVFGPDGTLYAVIEAGIITIDVVTGETILFNDDMYFFWPDVDGMVYTDNALYFKSNGEYISKLDLSTGKVSEVNEITIPRDEGIRLEINECLAYNYRDGLLYSTAYDIDNDESYLVSMDEFWIATTVIPIPNGVKGIAISPVDKLSPPDIQNLSADDTGCRNIHLIWDEPETDDLEFIWIEWTPTGSLKPLTITAGEEEALITSGIEPNTEYTITLRAVDSEGNMSEGKSLTVTTGECTILAPSGTLYFITSSFSGYTEGTLYTLDPATLETTMIGDTGLFSTEGLAVNPVDKKMFVTSNDTGKLYEVNPSTAEVTEIGSLGVEKISDITFGPDGTLYGWTETSDDLLTIDLSTGNATLSGDSGINTWKTGLAFDGETLLMKLGYDIYSVDTSTGVGTYIADFTGVLNFHNESDNFHAFDSPFAVGTNGYYYTSQSDFEGNSYLSVIDPDDWSVTFIGDIGIRNISAFEFLIP